MSNSLKTPKCPACGRHGVAISGSMYRCPQGCGFFDDDPDEGGYARSDNPERSAESKEEYLLRKKQREQQRHFKR